MTTILTSGKVALAARILLTFPFWCSGIIKLIDFEGGVAEMAHFGLQPAYMFNIATIVVQLVGSALIIADRLAWIGAGALAVFTGLTIVIAHHFWSITEEPFRTIAMHVSMEHVGMIGALLTVAVLSAHRSANATD